MPTNSQFELKVSTVLTAIGAFSFVVAVATSQLSNRSTSSATDLIILFLAFGLLPGCSAIGGTLALVNLARFRKWQFGVEAAVALVSLLLFLHFGAV